MNAANLPVAADYIRILPEIVLSIFGMVIMVLEPLLHEEENRRTLGAIGLAGAVAALLSTWLMAGSPGYAFWNMVRVDGFSVFFHVLVIAITIVLILTSYEYMSVQRIRAGEYYGLILFGAVGMCLMSSAVELVLIFIALEISSISTYILAGFRRRFAPGAQVATTKSKRAVQAGRPRVSETRVAGVKIPSDAFRGSPGKYSCVVNDGPPAGCTLTWMCRVRPV